MLQKTHQLHFKNIIISDAFWFPRYEINANIAIFHQWDQLIKTRCIDNFHIIAAKKNGFREGWFFSDSDAYKWLDAACRINTNTPTFSKKLMELIDGFIQVIQEVQEKDGYIFTYNQIHFPDIRWKNLWIEHELYCLGHLIEAIISYYEIHNNPKLLEIAIKAANLLVKEFSDKKPPAIPGHQEIEIALIKLYRITNKAEYLELAKKFVHRRGKSNFKWLRLLKQAKSNGNRIKQVRILKEKYLKIFPSDNDFKLPENVYIRFPKGLKKRVTYNYFTNKYLQNHKPIEEQIIPEGHAVRFSYLMTAASMLSYETGKNLLLDTLKAVHNHMVSKRMFIIGGIGSLPGIEGFGRDYELNPEYNYCETCAAIGSMYWNWEMTLLTADACYADLFEWQLYNAFLAGMSLDGRSYLYRNPLSTEKQKITRKEWYAIPCCPSNFSRTLASLGKYIYSYNDDNIWVHQYFGNETIIPRKHSIKLRIDSDFPWNGNVRIIISLDSSDSFSLHIRKPSWTKNAILKVNEETYKLDDEILVRDGTNTYNVNINQRNNVTTASGYSPYLSYYKSITREWNDGDLIILQFPMDIRIIKPHPKTKLNDKATLTRGPLVYCLESIDNPNLDIFKLNINPSILKVRYDSNIFDGINVIDGKTTDEESFTAIPYCYWGNRSTSEMNTILNI